MNRGYKHTFPDGREIRIAAVWNDDQVSPQFACQWTREPNKNWPHWDEYKKWRLGVVNDFIQRVPPEKMEAFGMSELQRLGGKG